MTRLTEDSEAYSYLGVCFEEYQRKAIQIAEDLHYSEETINSIRKASSETQISNILYDARNEV